MRYTRLILAIPFLVGITASQAHAQFKISPTYDTSITSDVNAATIENTIQDAINVYQNEFTNNVTVNIYFREDTSISLGRSAPNENYVSYSTYLAALTADKLHSPDSTAFLQYLPTGPDTGIAGSLIRLTTANERALGIAYSFPVTQDCYISLNTSAMNLSRTGPQNHLFDLQSLTLHEIDEALGHNSALNNLPNGHAAPTGAIEPMDLYRFSAPGVRSFDTGVNTNAYFSVDDGVTNLVNFNQQAGGDFSDYKSTNGVRHVQDAFIGAGVGPDLGLAELTALRVIGYNSRSAPVPEASTVVSFALLVSGLGLLALRSRKRSPSV